MHADRLIKLAELLERDAANPEGVKFDLGTWAAPSEPYERYRRVQFAADDLGIDDDLHGCGEVMVGFAHLPKITCGTTACALGLAMLSGEFTEWGLGGSAEILGDNEVQLAPSCNDETGFNAGAELFGITYHDSEYLFDPSSYGGDTPREAEGELLVAQRIRDFVAGIIDDEYHPDTRGANDEG